MILRRLGNKAKIAQEIQQYFPPHKIYIEPFFGAGGMFFNKPKAKYNFLNDIDNDVFNLFDVLTNNKDELVYFFQTIPASDEVFKYFKKNKPEHRVQRAGAFLFLSNMSFLGKADTFRLGCNNDKEITRNNIDKTYQYLINGESVTRFIHVDFRKVIPSISLKDKEFDSAFIYADPPYLKTTNTYSHSFTEKDSADLFETLMGGGIRFAMSEFDHPFILAQAEKYKLNVHTVGERKNLKNRRTELLITNYINHPKLF